MNSTSGSIRVSVLQVQSFEAGATSGTVSVEIARAGNLKIGTTSGNITARAEEFDKTDIGSTSGTITVFLRDMPGFTAKVETTSGRFEYELPLSKQASAYICGDGSKDVHLHTTSGNIWLKKLGA